MASPTVSLRKQEELDEVSKRTKQTLEMIKDAIDCLVVSRETENKPWSNHKRDMADHFAHDAKHSMWKLYRMGHENHATVLQSALNNFVHMRDAS